LFLPGEHALCFYQENTHFVFTALFSPRHLHLYLTNYNIFVSLMDLVLFLHRYWLIRYCLISSGCFSGSGACPHSEHCKYIGSLCAATQTLPFSIFSIGYPLQGWIHSRYPVCSFHLFILFFLSYSNSIGITVFRLYS